MCLTQDDVATTTEYRLLTALGAVERQRDELQRALVATREELATYTRMAEAKEAELISALALMLFDQHQHSSRPCPTCERARRAIGGDVALGCGKPFGNKAALAAIVKEVQVGG